MARKKYELGLYEKAMPNDFTWTQKLVTAKEAGFDFVELSVDETDERLARLDYTAAQKKEIADAMYDSGLAFRSLCLSGHRKYPFGSRDKATRERSLDIMRKAIDLAAFLGIRIIQLAGYDVYYETGDERTRAYFLENLLFAVKTAAAAGIMLGFETMETPFMDTTAKAMPYVRYIGSPYLGVYPDLGNCTNAALKYGGTVNDDLDAGRGCLIALHLKETVPGRYREVPFGTGHVDFAGGIKKAWELGVRRFVTECWANNPPDWKAEIAAARNISCSVLDTL